MSRQGEMALSCVNAGKVNHMETVATDTETMTRASRQPVTPGDKCTVQIRGQVLKVRKKALDEVYTI